MKTKSLIVLSVLAVAGIGLYFVLRGKPKNTNPELDLDANDDNILPFEPGATSEVDQPNNVREFQEWVINIKKDKQILGSGGTSGFGDDGKFGSKTQSAWKKYKSDFLKWKYNKPQIAQPSISDSLQKDIQTIIAMATGVFATKNFLETDINKPSKQSFVRAWANALRNNRANPSKGTVFVYRAGNQNILHESFSGKRLLGFNPIDRSPMPLTTARWYNNPKVSVWSYVGASAKPIGKINGLQYDPLTNQLWLYVQKPHDSAVSDPSIFGAKWIQANQVKF